MEKNINLLNWQPFKQLHRDTCENPTMSIPYLQADIFKNHGTCLKEMLMYYVYRGWAKNPVKHSALQKVKKMLCENVAN